MTISSALHERLAELGSTPPQDIFEVMRHEMSKHHRVLIIWKVDKTSSVISLADSTEPWQEVFKKMGNEA